MKIQRAPRGLQDFLRLQNFGRNPSELLDTVQAVIDLSPFFGVELFEIEADTVTYANPGDGPSVTIPAGEIWFVGEVSISHKDFSPTGLFATRWFIDLNVGDVAGSGNALEFPGLEYFTNAAGGPTPGQSWDVQFKRFEINRWYPSGTEFKHALISASTLAGAPNLSQRLLVYKVKG